MIERDRSIDYASPTELEQRQLRLLQKHLRYLQQASPYYRELLQQADFDPEQFGSLQDLQRLPLTGKDQLATRNGDFLAVEPRQVVDICQTSGTTGEPVTIWQTEADLQRLANNEQLAFLAAGIKATDRVLVGAALDRVFMAGLAYFLGLRQLGATVIRAGSGQPVLVAELIKRQRPNVLVGVPSLLLAVARQLQGSGLQPAALGVEKLICIGEPVRNQDLTLSALGAALQQHWQAQVLGTYASTELATAFADCTAGCGGHLLPELVVIELVDELGHCVADGEAGELVITPLGIEGTPLLRYRTGDIARLHREPCACGRTTPRLGPILGRRAQMLKVRGTTLFPGAVSSALQELEAVRGHYLEVYQDYDLSDRLRVVVGCVPGALSAEQVATQIAAKTRVKPEVVLAEPEAVSRKVLQPEQRKPVTFFDYRNRGAEQDVTKDD